MHYCEVCKKETKFFRNSNRRYECVKCVLKIPAKNYTMPDEQPDTTTTPEPPTPEPGADTTPPGTDSDGGNNFPNDNIGDNPTPPQFGE